MFRTQIWLPDRRARFSRSCPGQCHLEVTAVHRRSRVAFVARRPGCPNRAPGLPRVVLLNAAVEGHAVSCPIGRSRDSNSGRRPSRRTLPARSSAGKVQEVIRPSQRITPRLRPPPLPGSLNKRRPTPACHLLICNPAARLYPRARSSFSARNQSSSAEPSWQPRASQ